MEEDAEKNKVEGREENMAAWLVAVKTIRIQPYNLPPLGLFLLCLIFNCSKFVSNPPNLLHSHNPWIKSDESQGLMMSKFG